MIQNATSISHYPALRIEKSKQEYNLQVQYLSQLAWQIAYTALWNGEQFSAVEKEKAKELITAFINEQPNPKKAYSAFAQRVLLAKQYISTHPGTWAPIPTQWLSLANKNGFAGTQRWFDAVETTRVSLPTFKQPLKAFAEAILETVKSGNAKDFHYWRNYFAEKNLQAILNLFLSTLANCQNCKDHKSWHMS